MDEISNKKARYAQQIEDGRKIEAFTSTPEWQWYVDDVIEPTVEEYTERVLNGVIPTDKEDWIIRGMIQGMRLVVETTTNFSKDAQRAKKKAKELQKFLDEEDYGR